jgi:ergothioneine biosynthesis protein EgtC
MCRFSLYLGPPIPLSSLVTEPVHSLIHQSYQSEEREEPLNGDGFGVAWYAPEMGDEPAVFRSTTPAWSNRNLLDLARVVRSPCILAHVRAATQGSPVNEANCHPFRSGVHTFMHNGEVGGFSSVRRPLLGMLSDDAFHAIEGSTDSEHVFALFLDRLRRSQSEDPLERMAEALRLTIRTVTELASAHGGGEPSYLNLAAADGRRAVAARVTTDAPESAQSLYVNKGRRYVCERGLCRMLVPEEGMGAVVVSSERLSEDPGWEAVPPNHMLLVSTDRSVRVMAC